MTLIRDLINSFRRRPKTFEQECAEGVRQKTKAFTPKRARNIQSSTALVYNSRGQVVDVMTIKHGAHA